MANAKARPNPRVQNFASKGRFGDTEAAHVARGEMVIPPQVWGADPSLAQHATRAIAAMGADPRAYVVGHPKNNINPRTGAREFALQYTDQGWVDPAQGGGPIDFSTYNPNGGGNQQAPEQSQASFQPPAAGTPKQASQNWAPAPGSDAYYAQRAAGWEGAPAQNAPAPSFGFGGQNEMSASIDRMTGAGKQPNTDWGSPSISPAPTPSTTNEWGIPNNTGINQSLAQATGYNGQFGSGGFDSWINTQSPETQQRASGILQDAGQANRITWGDPRQYDPQDGSNNQSNGPTTNADGTVSYPTYGGTSLTYNQNTPDPFRAGAPTIWQQPIVKGVNDVGYAYGSGFLQPGMVPPDMMGSSDIEGTTRYKSMAQPNPTTGRGINNQYDWMDVRSGGTGDPYVQWTPEWAANQALEGNGYGYQALVNAGYDPAKYISGYKPGMEGMLASGQGTGQGSRAKYTTDKATSIRRAGGGVIYTYPDGVILASDGGQLTPIGNGLYRDQYGQFRDAELNLVNRDGSYIPMMGYPGSRTGDLARAYGDGAAAIVDAYERRVYGRNLAEGENATLPWSMSSDAGYGITAPGGAGAYGTGYPTTTGTTTGTPSVSNPQTTTTGNTNTNTSTGTPVSGTGLPAGSTNPASIPYGYSSPIINILGNTGTNGSGGLSPDILSLIASLNAGYGSSTYGSPYVQSQYEDTTGGGIQTTTPASQNVDFQSPFGY